MSEALLAARSAAYHDHPSHTTSCEVYRDFYGSECPCESYEIVTD